MPNHIIFPAAAIAGGAAGFALRMWQWQSAYDGWEERFLSGSMSSTVFIALVVALAVFFLLCSFKSAPGMTSPHSCPDPVYMTLMAAGGFAFFGAGVLGLLEGMEQMQLWRAGLSSAASSYPTALLLCAGLCLLAGVCVLLTGKFVYRPVAGKSASLSAVLPGFPLLVWIFATHQANATDPIFMGYGVYLSAAVLLTMANYDAAGVFHGQSHPRRMCFCTLMGSALAIVSLADGLTRFQMAIAAAAMLTALGHLYAMLSPAPAASEPETSSDPEL